MSQKNLDRTTAILGLIAGVSTVILGYLVQRPATVQSQTPEVNSSST